MRGRFLREKEFAAVDGKSSDDVPTAIKVPEEGRSECGFVKLDRRISIIDGQHGRDLNRHCSGLHDRGAPFFGTSVVSVPREQPVMAI